MALRVLLFSGIQRSNINRYIEINRNAIQLCSKRCVHLTPSNWKRIAFNLSDIGEGIREVVVKEWFVKEGDVVQQFDNLCEVQSDKASVTITSRYDGKILKIHHGIDDMALVGKPLVDFDVADDPAAPVSTSAPKNDISNSGTHTKAEPQNTIDKDATADYNGDNDDTKQKFLTTPAVRRIAHENNVDLSQVKATGPHGRILKSDVLEYLNVIPKSSQTQSTITPIDSVDTVEKLKDVRKAMFKSMTASLQIPHFTYCDEVNATALVQVRQQLKPETESIGVKLTFMPFFIKAASQALRKYPIVNSYLDADNESIVYKAAHNICIAMATPGGLVVPNIKDCQSKTILQIARDLSDLLERGRNGKLTPTDYANGTFSLSNIGVVGGTYTKPCITPPQVAIGAIGTTHIVPRFVGESLEMQRAHILNISWSADHRVIDGVTMAGFSNEWKRYIEHPQLFVLQ